MHADPSIIAGGFAEPVLNSQLVFSAVMMALSRPGSLIPLAALAGAPAPMTAEMAAVALTLCDHDSPVWLDPALAAVPAVADWLRFHTGAPLVVDPAQAMFALVADPAHLPPLAAFAPGTDAYPDRSATLVLSLATLTEGPALTLTGPGIRDTARLHPAPLPTGFFDDWQANGTLFPRGVDLVLVAPGRLAALPRTTRIGDK